MTVKLVTKWLQGLSAEEVSEVREGFVGTKKFRDRFIEILNDKIEEKRREIRDATNYDKPHWNSYVADSIGYERALTEVVNLLVSREKDT